MRSCSVIIPTRDRPDLLLRAVKSAFSALPNDGEVIVVDDAGSLPVEENLSQFNTSSLRVFRNFSPLGGGGSPSRNRGVAVARGRVIFFLDDDDEFTSGYCRKILEAGAPDRADFGFCARIFARSDTSGNAFSTTEDRGLPAGLISSAYPFARRTFPFSAGFWITQEGLESIGPMAESLLTNSDTEYCCRLYSSELKGWYSPEPGVIINDHSMSAGGQLDHVTKRTRAADRATAFQYIATKHRDYLTKDSGAALFVHQRWMKHALRADHYKDGWDAIALAPQLSVKARLVPQFLGWQLVKTLRLSRNV